ncbi:MAG TPA: hypothetical protein VNL91_02095 [Thermoanaerobaculia bacterium]|nr:hypothetical protein [Thermoanaerobaculia bacterium]
MAQFLLVTTLLTIAGLIATVVTGFQAAPDRAAQHILFALATTVVGLFSQSMTMFFFIGTGKEIKEKANEGGDQAEAVAQTRRFKAQVFPAATYAMAAIMITFITGGGVGSGRTPRLLHDVLAFGTIALFARAYWVEIRAMDENAKLMEKYLKSE